MTLTDQDTLDEDLYYLGQLQFATKKIQEVIEKLTDTDTPPIIIIQSDHGMRLNKPMNEYHKLMNGFNNLKAYYFPEKGKNLEFETTTPVNSFRVFFNLYFDDQYEILEDKMYRSNINDRFQFIEVTNKLR